MNLMWLTWVGSAAALLFAGYLAWEILKKDEGTARMKEIALFIRTGANAYLKRQYSVIAVYFAVVVIILAIMAKAGLLTWFVPFAFLSGGFFSGLSGFIGMKMATSSNARTTWAAKKTLNAGLRVAFSSGTVMGMVVVGLGLLDLSIWFAILKWYYSRPLLGLSEGDIYRHITTTMLTFGMGASSMALFARVGGGIFTKAADVGADLVGKVEAGIPEDDPRNPAVIADNVGDNVGDVAGMGADLYESYVGSILATMTLGAAAFMADGRGLASITVPMVMATVGVICSIIGTFLVRAGEEATQSVLLRALRRGIYTSTVLIAIAAYFLVKYTLGDIGIWWAVIMGLLAGNIIGFSTEYFTSDRYRPTRHIAGESKTSPATVIIAGLATGMLSSWVPTLTVAAASVASYFFAGGAGAAAKGLYGIGISAVGMLSTLGITLATDAYGPVADNAGGCATMSHLEGEVRKRTDALDSLGNTTAATGKGYAIGSAALTALALLAAYKEELLMASQKLNIQLSLDLSILNPKLLAGLFIGGALPFVFSSMTMSAIGRAASKMVEEVRTQFKEIKGLMEGKAAPDYARCVLISTKAAQKEMILPSLLAITAPIAIGLIGGAEMVFSLLAGSLVSGFILAIFMANSGGAWDNAKKYIEAGNLGGKGSSAHKAAVVGDTVGDPLKDCSGPSLNILIKLMSMVALVFAGLALKCHLF
ncbi:MAG: sodium-translocating pyrophosphatase [Candidatus Omnitrophota bacterium]